MINILITREGLTIVDKSSLVPNQTIFSSIEKYAQELNPNNFNIIL